MLKYKPRSDIIVKHKYSLILAIVLFLNIVTGSVWASVSYLGPVGTYTEEATVLFFGEKESITPVSTVPDALAMVKKGESQYAVVPVENTIGGPVYNYLDAVVNDVDLVIIGEVNLPIRQTLLALPGTELKDIKTVMSHPQGIAQSKEWLKTNLPQAKIVEVPSTAEGAKRVAEMGDKSMAAIAASRTATVYNLSILANDLQYTNTNITRFWVVTLKNNQIFGNQNTTLIARGSAKNITKLLTDISRKGFGVISLHDRPAKTKLGEYIYVIELSGNNIKTLGEIIDNHKGLLQCRIIGVFDAK